MTEPDEVVVALQALLGEETEVSLSSVDDVAFAVVRRSPEGETWVNLSVSLAAFPSWSPEQIAAAIAEGEEWH